MKKTFFAVFTLLISLAFTQNAFAHATPTFYEPESGSILEAMPERVRIHFSERIEPKASGITVFGPDGSRADNQSATIDPGDAHFYSIGVKNAGEGTYTVSWQVVSADDGHFTKGAFSFSVGKETAPAVSGQIQIQHITTLPQATAIAIELWGQAILLGALMLLLLIWRPLRKRFAETKQYEEVFAKRLSMLVLTGGALILIGTSLFIVIKTFDLQQLRFGSFFEILKVFLPTVDGYHTLFRGLLSIIFLGVFFVFRKKIFQSEKVTAGELGLIAILFLTLLSRARVSHAAASHFYPAFSIAVNFVHLIFKELWVGGLIAFSTILLPLFAKIKNNIFSASSLISFSRIVSVAFGIVGVSGAYIVWLHLKDPQYLITTEWGSRFILLSIFAGLLFATRLYHQFLVDRSSLKLCQGETNGRVKRQTSWLNYTMPLEMFLGVAVLAITSLAIITTPPYPPQSFSFEKIASSQGAEIRLLPYPYESKNFLIAVSDDPAPKQDWYGAGKAKKEVPLTNIVVTLTNEEKSIGPIVAETEQRFVGGYALSQKLFSPPGRWKVGIAAQRANAYDSVASFEFNYPEDIEATRLDPNKRTFGFFEVLMILSVLGIIAFSLLLYRFSKNLSATCSALDYPQSANTEISHRPYISWLIGFGGLIAISFSVFILYEHHLKTDFQKLCEKNGHFWLQSVPIRNGAALSSDTVTGCTLNVGLYHFADAREYQFFLRPVEAQAQLSITPEKPKVGIPTDLDILLESAEAGQRPKPALELTIEHDRLIHMLIVGEDLKTFAHIHAEELGVISEEMKAKAKFPLRYTFPKAGRYTILVDYAVRWKSFSQQFFVEVAGSPAMESPDTAFTREQLVDGYTINLSMPENIAPRKEIVLEYSIEKDGRPVENLEPYLAAPMHLAVIRADLGRFIHTHGELPITGSQALQQVIQPGSKQHAHFVPDRFGPKIKARLVFPQPGIYKIFGEFKHEGKNIVSDFTVKVE